jgi:hypothetical protein
MPGVARAQPPGLAFVPAGWWRACPLDRARARVSAAAESATEIPPVPRVRSSGPKCSRHNLYREGTLSRSHMTPLGRQKPLCREPKVIHSAQLCREPI